MFVSRSIPNWAPVSGLSAHGKLIVVGVWREPIELNALPLVFGEAPGLRKSDRYTDTPGPSAFWGISAPSLRKFL